MLVKMDTFQCSKMAAIVALVICATIGIVLRDFLPQNDDFLFDDLFSKANMPLQHCETSCEYFCYMPVYYDEKASIL